MMFGDAPCTRRPVTRDMHESLMLKAADGHEIPVYLWAPETAPRGVVQVFHGLGEHAGRYARFAGAARDRGLLVCAHDHRGHGPGTAAYGFFAERRGWDVVVTDGHTVAGALGDEYPGAPRVLLGHSMGSFIAQAYAMRHGRELAALVLSGSTLPSRAQVVPGRWLARAIALIRGRRARSALLDTMGFGAFNKQFEPARTGFDWLSRDPAEVDKYIADELCGGPYTTGLWIDFLGGLAQVGRDDSIRRIPTELPVLITGGSDDPVGGSHGMSRLAEAYRRCGHDRTETRIYAGGRHEMLNETNRDEFTNDVLDWIDEQLEHHQR